MFDKLIDVLIQFISYFQFWRVIPVNKEGVLIRWGKNPRVLKSGFRWVFPFEIDHIKTVIVEPEIVSTHSVHFTTTDLKTCVAAPVIKYKIIEPIKWLYEVNDAPTNLHDITRLYTTEILTDCDWNECMTKPIWTKIKNRIKDKTKDLGIEIEDFGIGDLAIIRIIITVV